MPEIDRQEMAENYGFALAFLNSNPELRKLFNQAVAGTWDVSKFVARLRGTKWFKHHSGTARQAIMLRTSDPATYRQRIHQMQATVQNTHGGIFGTGMKPQQARRIATLAFTHGWSEAELTDYLVKGVNFRKLLRRKNLGGTAAQMEQQIDEAANAYGVRSSHAWKAARVKNIVEGDETIDSALTRIREWSAEKYKAFAEDIRGGRTIADISEPYRQTMAELLELAPDRVDIRHPMVQRALRYRDSKGNWTALSVEEFADRVRADKRWQNTDNAREQYASVTADLLKRFGFEA